MTAKIINSGWGAITLPFPFRGILKVGHSVVVSGTANEVIAALGGSDHMGSLQVEHNPIGEVDPWANGSFQTADQTGKAMFPINSIVQFVDATDPNLTMGYGVWALVLPNGDNGAVLIAENPENGPVVGEQGFLVARVLPTDPNHFSRSDSATGGTTTSGQVVPWLCVKTWKRVS